MNYKSLEQIKEVVRGFEDATIDRKAWGHPEHLIVAFSFLSESDPEVAYERMKRGIFGLLDAYGVDLSKEMPYHETLTRFWLNSVAEYLKAHPEFTVENINRLIESRDKHYPSRFYSERVLFSKKARREYVEPDLVG